MGRVGAVEQVSLAFNNRYREQRKKLLDRVRQWAADTGDNFEFLQQS